MYSAGAVVIGVTRGSTAAPSITVETSGADSVVVGATTFSHALIEIERSAPRLKGEAAGCTRREPLWTARRAMRAVREIMLWSLVGDSDDKRFWHTS